MYCALEKYKYIFGKPREGAHSTRLFNIAVIDVLFTILLAVVLSKLFSKPFGETLVFCFVLGIILHAVFCVDTTVHRMLFGKV